MLTLHKPLPMPRVAVERRLSTPAATPSTSSMPLNRPAQGGTAAEGKSTNSVARAVQRENEGSADREVVRTMPGCILAPPG